MRGGCRNIDDFGSLIVTQRGDCTNFRRCHLTEALSRGLKPGASPCLLLPALDNDVGVFRIELDQPRPATGTLRRDECGARSAEWIEDDVSGLGRVTNGALDKRDRLHGRVQIIPRGLVEKPDIALVAIACPCRKLDPHVLVMQSTQDWAADYATNGLDGARDRRILVQ